MKGKTAVFIDGANLWASTKKLGFHLDFKALEQYLREKHGELMSNNYFTAVVDRREVDPIRPLLDWLDYNGYHVHTKPAKTLIDPETNVSKLKGNMDLEMAMSAVELAPKMDQVIFFTGDGDFTCVVKAIQRMGIRVIIYSTVKTTPPMCADELRRAANEFVDLYDLKTNIRRDVRPSDVPKSFAEFGIKR